MHARRMDGSSNARGASARADARNLRGISHEFGEASGRGLRGEAAPLSWLRLVEHGTADRRTERDGPHAGVAAGAARAVACEGAQDAARIAPRRVASLKVGPMAARRSASPALETPEIAAAAEPVSALAAEPGASASPEQPSTGDSSERSRIVAELYQANYHRVFGFARRLVGDDEAEEVAHEAFCRLLKVRNLERMTISTAYLLRIAENLIRRKYERAQRYRVVLERSGMVVSDTTEDSQVSRRPGGAGSCELEESGFDSSRLATVLRQLTNEEQAAVRLIVCDGLGYQAAARALGVPVSTINNWKYRGLVKLRQLIDAPAGSQSRASTRGFLAAAI